MVVAGVALKALFRAHVKVRAQLEHVFVQQVEEQAEPPESPVELRAHPPVEPQPAF